MFDWLSFINVLYLSLQITITLYWNQSGRTTYLIMDKEDQGTTKGTVEIIDELQHVQATDEGNFYFVRLLSFICS